MVSLLFFLRGKHKKEIVLGLAMRSGFAQTVLAGEIPL
jgi:hypothetical protein